MLPSSVLIRKYDMLSADMVGKVKASTINQEISGGKSVNPRDIRAEVTNDLILILIV